MTLQEFEDDITTWSELYDFCNENGLESYVEDLIFEDDLDEAICEDLREATYEYSWMRIRDWLSNIDTGYDCYRRDGMLDYMAFGDYELSEMKDEIIDNVDDDFWDAEEEDEEESEPELEFETPFSPSTFDDLHDAAMAASTAKDQYIAQLREMEQKQREEQRQYEQERNDLFMAFISEAMMIKED